MITLVCTGRGTHRRMKHYRITDDDGTLMLHIRPRKQRAGPLSAVVSGQALTAGNIAWKICGITHDRRSGRPYSPAFARTLECTVPGCPRRPLPLSAASFRRLYEGAAAAGRREVDISRLPF